MIVTVNQTETAPLLPDTNSEDKLSDFSQSSSNGDSFQLLSERNAFDYLDLEVATVTQATSIKMIENSTMANASSYNATYNTTTLDPVLIERFLRNRAIDNPWFHILISLYIVLIIFGAVGNILVVIAVVRKPIMRTARNLFILNLATSDLLLCVVTMPLTLVEIVFKYWPFGSCSILCRTIGLLQALCIFVSTISITAIAFDRYQVIVYPTRDSLQVVGAFSILVCIWLLALLLATPMFIFKKLISTETPKLLQQIGLQESITFCIEDWPINNGRFYYSIFSLCVQYLVPILIVSMAYFGIYNKLRSRITVVTVQSSAQRRVERGRRMKRTKCLLISIAIIFGVSWMPLNIFNLYADMQRGAVTQNMLVIYAICHMIGMSSACSNPLLYGWLNENFRKEFRELICQCTFSTNDDLTGPTTGSNMQAVAARRRRKHGADMSKGELELLDHSCQAIAASKRGPGACGGCGCCVGCGGGGDGDCENGINGISMATTDFVTGHRNGGSRLRSAVTESVALTENPMPTEIAMDLIIPTEQSKLMPRLEQY
ncbi:neuropeptide F receptor isoform X1 [Drosophila tropicalis]|uniref:neuropeptide F receptor isoform X1 n=1 Tax=Drosophila tropicalis TaxID=46794 RepID=UPI0035ABEE8B